MQWQWNPYGFGKNQTWNQIWNKAWSGFGGQNPWLKQPTWTPTPGGGWAKQYPPGQVGIPYAWYPEYGLVQ
ncbi:MAG TPA: hypothetical protein VNT75_24450 [Symbiobacteriaceae bacterium]|nr:hypothetical protein [Symbiobacteriaceae bacterium]